MNIDHLFPPGSKWTQDPPCHPMPTKMTVNPASPEDIERARQMAVEANATYLQDQARRRAERVALKKIESPGYGLEWCVPGGSSPDRNSLAKPVARVRDSVLVP